MSEFQPFLEELAVAPENIREMWRYAIVLVMIDDEKARVLGTRVEEGHEFIAVRTITGNCRRVWRVVRHGESDCKFVAHKHHYI